jgi:hypothetical protein
LRALRFLNRFKLISSPITIPHAVGLEKAVSLKKNECGEKPKRAPAIPVVIVRKSLVIAARSHQKMYFAVRKRIFGAASQRQVKSVAK